MAWHIGVPGESVLIRAILALITAIPLSAEAVTHLDGFIPRLGVARPPGKGVGPCRERGGSCRRLWLMQGSPEGRETVLEKVMRESFLCGVFVGREVILRQAKDGMTSPDDYCPFS